jgi:hypothetical protein
MSWYRGERAVGKGDALQRLGAQVCEAAGATLPRNRRSPNSVKLPISTIRPAAASEWIVMRRRPT